MGNALANELVKERESLLGTIETLSKAALDSGRDLNEDDKASIGKAKERVGAIDSQLDLIAGDLSMSESVRERLAAMPGSTVQKGQKYRSGGEVLYDVLHQSDPDSEKRYREAKKRAADHMGNLVADTAAGTGDTEGDLDGIAVQPIVGPTVVPYWRGMPLVSALGPRNIPAYTFERPYLVDPGIDTGVDAQGQQKAELPSEHFDIESDILKGTTLGGYLNVSQQLLSLQPGSLGIVLEQMRLRMSRKIENFVVTEMELSTGVEDLPAGSDSGLVLAALYNASASYHAVTGGLASILVCGPTGWAKLGAVVDLSGRPLLPTMQPVNGLGSADATDFQMTGPAGLRVVVSPAITHADWWVTGPEAIEPYLFNFPVLEAVEPSVLGRQVAVASSVVAHRPTPLANASIKVYDATP